MNRRELTEAEIAYALTLPNPNDRKSYIQGLIVDYFRTHPKLLVTAFTRFGKGFMCTELAKQLTTRTPSATISTLLFTTTIQKEWNGYLAGIPNVVSALVATFSRGGLPPVHYSSTLFICDEVHHCANESAQLYSQSLALVSSPYQLLLSATVTKDQRTFLSQRGFTDEFHVPLKVGRRLGIIPMYENINIPVGLYGDEQSDYLEQQDGINDSLRIFERISVHKAAGLAFLCANKGKQSDTVCQSVAGKLGVTPWTVKSKALAYRKGVAARAKILYTARQKEEAAYELLQKLPRQLVLVFGRLLESGDRLAGLLPDLQVYRSGSPSKKDKAALAELLHRFYSGEKPYLYGCKALDEGFTVNNCSTAINIGVAKSELSDTQRIGRLLGIDPANPTKRAQKFNVFVDDFYVGAQLIPSQERVWLEAAQKNQLFITYLDSLSDIDEVLD